MSTLPRHALDHAAAAMAHQRDCQRYMDLGSHAEALEAADACAEAHARAADSGDARWRQHHLLGARVVVSWATAMVGVGR